jgi:nitroreductase
MDVLKLIKQRSTTRHYTNKPISQTALKKILEAGIWGPALHHFQPWKFVIIKDVALIKKINRMVEKKLEDINTPTFLLYPTIKTMANSKLLICVYNTKDFTRIIERFNKEYFKKAELAEISAIAAAIQNMLLEAENLGIGTCWLDMPLFCREEINKLLKIKDEMVAVLTLGYPLSKGKRSPRKKNTVVTIS